MASVLRVRLALGVLALAACVDSQAPDTPSLEPSFKKTSLPVLSTIKVDMAEQGALPSEFTITLRFVTPAEQSVKRDFRIAARKWQGIIVRDVPSITGTIPRNACGDFGTPRFNGTIDDLLIDVLIGEIDGPGNVLGFAGPCAIRFADNLPAYGVMFFDVVDVPLFQGFELFDEVVIHEMGHVLGFGTLWNFERALLLNPGAFHPRFDGRFAKREWHELGGVGRVPVEGRPFGPGQADAHWDEDTFDNELMTGFLNLGVNPLSDMSALSMRDLGYGVVANGDPYELPSLQVAAARASSEGINIGSGERILRAQAVIE